MSTVILNQLAPDTHDDDYLGEQIEELDMDKYKLSDSVRKFSLDKCLHSFCFKKIFENFGAENIKYFCENFGVNDVNQMKLYEREPAKFFSQMLADYAVDQYNIERTVNMNNLNSLLDLQAKLWQLNNGKLVCKILKEKENGN